jgi:hypothetical protein
LGFSEHWFASGGASFLAGLIKERKINPASFNSRDFLTDSLNAIDVGAGCSPKTLLFQAGCLTVGRTEKKGSGKKVLPAFPQSGRRRAAWPVFGCSWTVIPQTTFC